MRARILLNTKIKLTFFVAGLLVGNFAVNINMKAQCNVSLKGTDVSCKGLCDGSAQVNTLSGTSPYTYSWSTGGTYANTYGISSGLCAGTYTITVTDAVACSSTNTITITEPTLLTVTTSIVQDISCFGSCNGVIVATLSGGSAGWPGYRYTWSSGISGPTASNLCAYEYTVTVIDANSCYAYTTQPYLTKPTQIVVTTSTTSATNGNADGSATVNATGGTPGYSYAWSNGANSQTAVNLVCGPYTVTISDANGCTVTSAAVVNCISGINESNRDASFSIYPNPATNNITIEATTNTSYTIQLINLLGEMVYNTPETIVNKTTIDVGVLPKGIYFVEIQNKDNNTQGRQKLVIR